MAIAPTGDIFKTLEFDGESSKSYGVYITGEAVYNAPEKDVEMISIPGRNGSFALDKGRFENIEVTYPAGIFATNEFDFATAVADFRNYLCSKKGYCRLTDDYNPDEFRMAIYKSGLEVEPTQLKAGEFEITFDCKPQRYLMGGESPITVEDGDIILNPTLFDAKPMLEADGYGTIAFNGHTVTIKDGSMGDVELQNHWSGDQLVQNANTLVTFYDVVEVPTGVANSGDAVTANLTATVRLQSINDTRIRSFGTPTNVYVTDGEDNVLSDVMVSIRKINNKTLECIFTLPVSYSIDGATQSTKYVLHFTITPKDSEGVTAYGSIDCYAFAEFFQTMHPSGGIWLVTDVRSVSTDQSGVPKVALQDYTISYINMLVQDVYVTSTMSANGNPTYIDCEIGEAYKITDGEKVSLNKYVNIGAELPTLSKGTNTFEVANTIDDLKVIPRWWKI